jgi:hypothetical protein
MVDGLDDDGTPTKFFSSQVDEPRLVRWIAAIEKARNSCKIQDKVKVTFDVKQVWSNPERSEEIEGIWVQQNKADRNTIAFRIIDPDDGKPREWLLDGPGAPCLQPLIPPADGHFLEVHDKRDDAGSSLR